MGKSLTGKNLGKGYTQRKDGMYQGEYHINGKRKFLYDRNFTKLKKKIKEKEKKIEERNKRGIDPDIDPFIKFDELYNLWRDKKAPCIGIKQSTINLYDIIYKLYIKDKLGKYEVASINKRMLENVYYYYVKQKYSSGTLNNIRNVCNNTFNLAVDVGLLDYNPMYKVHIKIKNDIKVKEKPLSLEDQIIILKNEHDKMFYNITLILIHTGLRVSELIGLTKEEIDFNNEMLNIDHQCRYEKVNGHYKFVIKPTKSETSNREISLDELAIKALKNQIELSKDMPHQKGYEDFIFVTEEGKPLLDGTIRHHYTMLYKRIGDQLSIERLHPHLLRHTYATICLECGVHSRVIQESLGHTNDRVTQMYAHVTNNMKKNEVKKINNLYKDFNF